MKYLKHPFHIVPIIISGAAAWKEVAQKLLYENNIYVQPIVYSTVPVGLERLRLTPSALHTEDHVHLLVDALKEIKCHEPRKNVKKREC